MPFGIQWYAQRTLHDLLERNTLKQTYEHDNINGKLVPPLVISDDHILTGTHSGTVHVETGTLRIQGTLQGTLDVQSHSNAIIMGRQQGTVIIARNATVIVVGELQRNHKR